MGSEAQARGASYIVSSLAHHADNDAGRNHWSAYAVEVLDQLGLTAGPIDAGEMTPERLAGLRVLVLPQPSHGWLDEAVLSALPAWVEAGGLLIGFGALGLDELFGVAEAGATIEQADEFAPSAGMLWQQHALTRGVIWPLHPDAPGPVLSPMRSCTASSAEALATALTLDGEPTENVAVSHRELGNGACLYFAFDAAKHMWIAHHGRPVDADYDGDGYFRLSDAVAARQFEPETPYADQIIFLLREVVGRAGLPLLSPIPPMANTREPAEVLLFWGGDGEAAEGTQVPASDFMRDLGLPYHLNLMPDKQGRFVVSKAQFDALKANGHEPSLHYDFQSGFDHPYAFTEAEILQQAQWYEEAFGERAKVSVFHWCHWTGWSEPAEWMLKAGGRGDNSRIHRGSPPINPANMLGYSFGTSLPYHFYRDHRGGNERLEFVSQPITLYECGYDGPEDKVAFESLHRGLEMALRYHLTADMFFHPINIHRYASCREAVRETLRWLEERSARAVHMGNDELAEWWMARSNIAIRGVRANADHTELTVDCEWPGGCVVEIPAQEESARVCSTAGDCPHVFRDEPWGRRLLVSCPHGTTSLTGP